MYIHRSHVHPGRSQESCTSTTESGVMYIHQGVTDQTGNWTGRWRFEIGSANESELPIDGFCLRGHFACFGCLACLGPNTRTPPPPAYRTKQPTTLAFTVENQTSYLTQTLSPHSPGSRLLLQLYISRGLALAPRCQTNDADGFTREGVQRVRRGENGEMKAAE
jgi:hypothetical protein